MKNKEMTELREKAISIKGKEYILVKDRVLAFNEYYPNGCIITERLSEGDMEIFKATVTPDVDKPERKFTGYSQAKRAEDKGKMDINITAAMENAETSAVGRALAMMGIGVIDSIASADEMKKAEGSRTVLQSTVQKEASKANTGSNEEKPWFNQENLDKFTSIAKQYKNADEALQEIKAFYRISRANEEKVRKLYEDLKSING